MEAKKKTITLIVALLVIGLAGAGAYAYWVDQQFKESEELAAQEEERIVAPVSISDIMDGEDMKDEDMIENTENQEESTEVEDMENQPPVQSATPDPIPVRTEPQRYTGTWQSHRDYVSKGGIEILEQGDEVIIQTTSDYTFSGAPDPFLYLSSEKGTSIGNAISLGKLQKNNGVQAYKVSKAEFDKFNGSVVIWCQAFNLYMGRADIEAG